MSFPVKHRNRAKQQKFSRSFRKSRSFAVEPLEKRNLLTVVSTDLPDYAPGATANIYANSFEVGEAVQFQVLHNDGTPNTGNGHGPWTVIDGSIDDLDGKADGNIWTTWFVDPDDSNGSSFDLTAVGVSSGLSAAATFTDAGSTLSQFANKPTTSYQTGSLNGSNSEYVEGNSIPFRYLVANLQEGADVVLDIIYQFQSDAAGPRTYDFLTGDSASQAITDTERFGPDNASKPAGFDLTSSTNLVLVPIPDDAGISTDTGGNFRLASNVPVSIVSVSTPAISGSPDEKHIQLVIHLTDDGDATPNENIVDLGVFWGGHLARDTDYAGTNNGASDAPGASFHMRAEGFQDINGNGMKDSGEDNLGGGDRSIQGGVVVHTSLAWEKRRADTNELQGGATFTITPNPLTGLSSLTIVDNGTGDVDPDDGQIQIDDILFGTYTITETVPPPGFNLDPDPTRVQSITSANPIAVVGTQGENDAGTSDESDFHNPLQVGSIAWEKRTEAGSMLGGATFTVTPNPQTGSGTMTVVDDTDGVTSLSDVDQDPTPGKFLIKNVLYGTYVVTESVPPTGYFLDDFPSRNVTVSALNVNAAIGTQGTIDPGNTNSSDFFDPPFAPQIAIDKVTVDGATSGDGLNILAGDAISWRYTVTNTGNVALSNVSVSDNKPGVTPVFQSGDANNNSLLDLNETWIYSAAGTATAGSYSNLGTASGTDSIGTTVTNNDASSYFGGAPQIAINKVTVDGATSGDGLNILAGDAISWRYTVTNTGNVALSNVSVSDNKPGVTPVFQSGDANNNSLLDLNETWIYSAAGTATAGSYSNLGTASGRFTDSAGHIANTSANDASSYFGGAPQIAINKVTVDGATSGDGLNILAGDAISWRYTVTNTGNVALSNVSVSDNKPGVTPVFQSGDGNNNSLLDLNETWIYSAAGTATAGSYSNLGTASGRFTDSAGHIANTSANDASSYFGGAPQIAINKVTVDGATSGDGLNILAGDAISWRYTVTNTGNVALSNVSVSDNKPGVTPVFQSGDGNNNSLLDLNETWIYSAAGTATAGSYSNLGTASGRFTDSAGHIANTSANDASSYFGGAPQIAINKVTVDGATSGDGLNILAGDAISWRYTVTNTGNVALSNVSVSDNKPGVTPVFQSGDGNNNSLLDLNETWIYSAAGTATAGSYSNLGTASGRFTDSAGHIANTSANDASSYFGGAPQIAINKVTVDGATSGDGLNILAGDAISWRYTVTNTGNVALSNVSVSDNKPGVTPVFQSGDANNNSLLDLNETWIYSAAGTATAGSYSNLGTASGRFTDSAGHIANTSANDASSYFGGAPQIAINKVTVDGATSGDGLNILAGDAISWRYTVTNTGNVALSNVSVSDNKPGVTPVFQSGDGNNNSLLDLNETWIYSAAGTATAGSYSNLGTASGRFTDSAGHIANTSANDASSYFGQRDIIVIAPDKQNTSAPLVKVVDKPTGKILSQFYAYETNFQGGVRVATGDMNGDGIDEIITAPGRARAPEIRVFTQTGVELTQFRTMAYSTTFTGGVKVAVGDVNGDGKLDIVAVPTYGATQARVFYNNFNAANPSADPISNTPNKQFEVFGSSFLGGADVVLADVGTFSNGATINATTPDGKAEIIVGNGPGLRSTIYVYDVTGTPKVVDTILPFSSTFKGGITLETARINADAIPDLIVSSGNGGQSAVEIWSGLTNDAADVRLSTFKAFANTSTANAPVHATALDTNGDGIADTIVVVQGTDGTSGQIRSYSPNGSLQGTLNGFAGSWNISRLRRPSPTLTDAAFAQLGK